MSLILSIFSKLRPFSKAYDTNLAINYGSKLYINTYSQAKQSSMVSVKLGEDVSAAVVQVPQFFFDDSAVIIVTTTYKLFASFVQFMQIRQSFNYFDLNFL